MRKLALVVILGAIMTILDTTIVNVALTPLARDFGTSLSTVQWVLTGYTLALAMTIPLTGWATGRFGAKTTWIAALLVFLTGSVLCGMAWNVTSLIAFRVLQGAGGGMILPVGQIMLAHKAGSDRMGRVMSVIAVPAMLGPVLGPVLGGLILDDLSWRWMFYVNLPVGIIAVVLSARLLPADRARSATRIDVPGLLLLPPGLAVMTYGLSKAGSDNGQLAIWLAVGAALVAAFAVHALRTSQVPLVSVRSFSRRPFTLATVATAVYTGAVFGFMVVLPVYFQVVRGQSPLRAGLMFAPLGLGAMLATRVSGQLTDRFPARRIAPAGMALVAVAAIFFTQIGPATSLAVLAVALLIAGLGHGTVLPPMMGSSYQDMPRSEIPSATATFNASFRVGSAFGAAALAVVLQQAIRARIPTATSGLNAVAGLRGPRVHDLLTSAFAVSFWWVAALALLAAVPALLIPRRAPAPAEPAGEAATEAPARSV